MSPQEAFKNWLPSCIVPSHEEAFKAGWEACCNLYDGRKVDANDPAEAIYAAYPRKVGRQDAIKAIRTAMKIRPAMDLLRSTNAYADATTRWPVADRQFIPHPATWFNRGSYDDDPKEWTRNAVGTVAVKRVFTAN
jgi:hypothetical protein